MSHRNLGLAGQSLLLLLFIFSGISVGQEANFIWSPQIDATEKTEGSKVFYRKRFSLVSPEKAELHIAAGDSYGVFINGQQVIQGQSYGTKSKVDVSDFLQPGINTIAASVQHIESDSVGLAIRLRVKEKGEVRYRSLVTDPTWKSYIREVSGWQEPRFNDLAWLSSSIIGQADVLSLTKAKSSSPALPEVVRAEIPVPKESTDAAKPADVVKPKVIIVQPQPVEAASNRTPGTSQNSETASTVKKDSRFEVHPNFIVEQLLTDDETGSVIAMEFDEFGRLLLSREGSGLYIADLTLPVDSQNRVEPYCNQVTNIQGILPLNGRVYVTGEGPQGQGLYCLEKQGRRMLGVTKTLLRFSGKPSEHGAHGIQLGPDGFLYISLGNGTQLEDQAAASSPYQHPYEGDLVQRYEDPNGQSAGVKAPGGTIVRTSLDGSKVETVAGGLRNAYDIVFDAEGHLFFHDSDMETDQGASWYRPNMIYNVAAGGDYGWRSGWAKFPQHFIDQIPAITDTGRGSPTGAVIYQHTQLPARYHNSMFFADWTLGKIFSVELYSKGAGFVGQANTFLKGKPLNVCDLAVSPTGTLCFCTGGRATEGGVYQVRWQGETPADMNQFDSNVERVIRQPQPRSAWGRQQLSQLRRTIGDRWGGLLTGVAQESRNEVDYRIRALDLMVLYGPKPTPQLLDQLAKDDNPTIRSAAARACGITEGTQSVIGRLAADGNPMVRRCAIESALRQEIQIPLDTLLPMLRSFDRIESTVARRMLERLPTNEWIDAVLETDDSREFIQGALAICVAHPSTDNSYKVLARVSHFMDGFVNDADFIDMIRISQLAMVRGEVDPEKIPAFSTRIASEFPAGNSVINGELVRLLAYLQNDRLEGRLEEYLTSIETPPEDKLHAAMMMQTLGSKLSASSRLQIISTLEELKEANVMSESQAWIRRAIRDVASTIQPDQIQTVLNNGSQWTDATLAALFVLPKDLSQDTINKLQKIDSSLVDREGEDIEQLRTGILAVLAENGGEQGMDYLRKMWRDEPQRRNDISLGLAQKPEEKNWAYLVSSIKELDDTTGAEVLVTLAQVQRKPRDAKHYRDVIELGYRMRENGIAPTSQLLQHWSGTILPGDGKDWRTRMDAWKIWYQETFPSGQPVSYSPGLQSNRSAEIENALSRIENGPRGNAENGRLVFEAANCAKCHRCNGLGQTGGPDLTKLASRYSLREMVEATVDPNLFVADRYRASKVLLEDGRLVTGMSTTEDDGAVVVLTEAGKKLKYTADQVDDIQLMETSPMPAGALESLTDQQLADLFSFLGSNQ